MDCFAWLGKEKAPTQLIWIACSFIWRPPKQGTLLYLSSRGASSNLIVDSVAAASNVLRQILKPNRRRYRLPVEGFCSSAATIRKTAVASFPDLCLRLSRTCPTPRTSGFWQVALQLLHHGRAHAFQPLSRHRSLNSLLAAAMSDVLQRKVAHSSAIIPFSASKPWPSPDQRGILLMLRKMLVHPGPQKPREPAMWICCQLAEL